MPSATCVRILAGHSSTRPPVTFSVPVQVFSMKRLTAYVGLTQ
jgi:hypothetical protein